ncbi:MAG: hypothetical protein KF884_01645 [Fimbriimonadaceae bacterium]|nr:hypothetical protein [Fimbriimonadaceae bacterium]QYK58798.1 MAG: hypothetical protein KF884_01645 [Fimbriimonadaceae bacterium]
MPYPIVVRPTSASQKPSSQQQRAHRLQVDNLEVQAREALTKGDRKEAMRLLLEVDRLDPLAIEAWELLGYLQAFGGEPEIAAMRFKNYFDGQPDIKLVRTPLDIRT